MCLVRAVGIMAHALCADAGVWVLNEKGLVDRAAHVPNAPADFATKAHALLADEQADDLSGALTDDLAGALSGALDRAATLLDEVRVALR